MTLTNETPIVPEIWSILLSFRYEEVFFVFVSSILFCNSIYGRGSGVQWVHIGGRGNRVAAPTYWVEWEDRQEHYFDCTGFLETWLVGSSAFLVVGCWTHCKCCTRAENRYFFCVFSIGCHYQVGCFFSLWARSNLQKIQNMINNNKNDWAVISPAFQWAQGMNDVLFFHRNRD